MSKFEYIRRGEHLSNPNPHKQYARLSDEFSINYKTDKIGKYIKAFSIRGIAVDVNCYGEYSVMIAVSDTTYAELNFEIRYAKRTVFMRENSLLKNIDLNNIHFVLAKEPSQYSMELWIDVYIKLTEQGLPLKVLPRYNMSRSSEFYLNINEIEYKELEELNSLNKLKISSDDSTSFALFGLTNYVEETEFRLSTTIYNDGRLLLSGSCKIKNINSNYLGIGYTMLSFKDEFFNGIIRCGNELRTVVIWYHANSNLIEVLPQSIDKKELLTDECILYINQVFNIKNRYNL